MLAPGRGLGVMRNGLYSIHVQVLDGHTGRGSGILVFRDGVILGGDAFLYYTGTYTVNGDTLKGEVLINQHTRASDPTVVFGGQQVSLGFSGQFTDDAGTLTGTALVGRTSQFFKGTLRRLADAG